MSANERVAVGNSLNALLTPLQMGLVDKASIVLGRRSTDLMEAAGRAVAEVVQQRWSRRPVLVLCGPGNNGGDGFVAARFLSAAGWQVRLALLGSIDKLSEDAAHHASLWIGTVESFAPDSLDDAPLVIDAIFGAGLARPVDGAARVMIEAMALRGCAICSIDVPSGLDGATGAVLGAAAAAEVTVTFFRKKPGHLLYPGRALCGEVIVADIGTPETVFDVIGAPIETWENSPKLWQREYPWPRADGHKYERGHALILGGVTITGASRLTSRAAMRIGAGVATLAVLEQSWAIYSTALTGVMVHALRNDTSANFDQDFAELLADGRRNAIAIGPGTGVNANTQAAVLAALATCRPVVLDADALTSFATKPERLWEAISGPCVLTPHEGEFARLFSASGDKLTRARQAAKQSSAVIVLKGSDTVIAEPGGRAVINSNAPATLATAGSGDVLTGMILGLLAQGLDPFNAACAATWLHGEVANAFGQGLVAEDLLDALPGVLANLYRRR